MSRISREDSVLLSIKLIDRICEIQQYDRLILNKIFKHESFDDVYKKQMKRLIKIEEYEKCALLMKLYS